MEILYLLLPVSLVFVLVIGGFFWWAVFSGQYDDPEAAGKAILLDDDDAHATPRGEVPGKESPDGIKVDSCQWGQRCARASSST
ncbi:hypothetical protein ISE1_2527 [plant metagenome]|uniref:Type cbb3 cytochrome oxidase biogenesis protein CcoS, involved in heme b insertion n=1 Tax=plant metagenome TaxID=1297885 RepID=A0A484SRI7_9ZZZZ